MIDVARAERVRELLGRAFRDDSTAWDELRAYMIAQGLHVDDLGIGGVGTKPGIEPKTMKRVRDLLACAIAGELPAWEKLRAHMARENLGADDLGIGGVSEAGTDRSQSDETKDAGGSDEGREEAGGGGGAEGREGAGGGEGAFGGPEPVGLQGEPYILDWLSRADVRCAYDHALTWGRDPVDPHDRLSRVGRQRLTLRKIIRALRREAARDEVKLPLSLIHAVLADWIEEQRRLYAREVFSQIDHVDTNILPDEQISRQKELEDLCALRLNDDPRYATAVILTIIHQIKRKILGLPVDHPLVLMICSQWGATGKSKFIEAILSPLRALMTNTTLGQILDERTAAVWEHYAINLDDIDESAAYKKGQFRRVISQDEWSSRVLGSGDIRKIVKNATLLGSTHHRIYEIMPDMHSMRRFAELFGRETPPDPEAIAAVDGADWGAIWRAVDPEGPRPIDQLGYGAILRARQEDARVKGPVEQWLEAFTSTDPGYTRHADRDGWIRSGDLYLQCYVPYAAENLGRQGQLKLDGFAKQLGSLLRGLGARAPLEVRKGRETTVYRSCDVSPDRSVAPEAPRAPTSASVPPRPDTTRH